MGRRRSPDVGPAPAPGAPPGGLASGLLRLRTSIHPAWHRACTQLPPLPVDRLDMIHPISPSITAPLWSDVPVGWARSAATSTAAPPACGMSPHDFAE